MGLNKNKYIGAFLETRILNQEANLGYTDRFINIQGKFNCLRTCNIKENECPLEFTSVIVGKCCC